MSNNRLAIYDCNAVVCVIADIPILEGRVKGTYLKFSPDGENWGTVQDCGGLVSRFRTNNRLWTMELTLHQTSIHHAQLSAIYGADHNAVDGSGVAGGFIKDLNGATLCTIPHLWVKKGPDMEFGEEVKEWTWLFQCVSDPSLIIVGGN